MKLFLKIKIFFIFICSVAFYLCCRQDKKKLSIKLSKQVTEQICQYEQTQEQYMLKNSPALVDLMKKLNKQRNETMSKFAQQRLEVPYCIRQMNEQFDQKLQSEFLQREAYRQTKQEQSQKINKQCRFKGFLWF